MSLLNFDSIIDIHSPVLTIFEFQKKRNLTLNEQCLEVFFDKTVHLKGSDFVEIDRNILEFIGFKNTRSDFFSAIRCIRSIKSFKEGHSLNDTTAHYVIQNCGIREKQAIWIRMRLLDHFAAIANTPNSGIIFEYFQNLDRIVSEYKIYKTIYLMQRRSNKK